MSAHKNIHKNIDITTTKYKRNLLIMLMRAALLIVFACVSVTYTQPLHLPGTININSYRRYLTKFNSSVTEIMQSGDVATEAIKLLPDDLRDLMEFVDTVIKANSTPSTPPIIIESFTMCKKAQLEMQQILRTITKATAPGAVIKKRDQTNTEESFRDIRFELGRVRDRLRRQFSEPRFTAQVVKAEGTINNIMRLDILLPLVTALLNATSNIEKLWEKRVSQQQVVSPKPGQTRPLSERPGESLAPLATEPESKPTETLSPLGTPQLSGAGAQEAPEPTGQSRPEPSTEEPAEQPVTTLLTEEGEKESALPTLPPPPAVLPTSPTPTPESPTPEEPVTTPEQPVTTEPVSEPTEEPVTQPAPESPSPEQPVTTQPATEEPVITQPTQPETPSEQPVSEGPTIIDVIEPATPEKPGKKPEKPKPAPAKPAPAKPTTPDKKPQQPPKPTKPEKPVTKPETKKPEPAKPAKTPSKPKPEPEKPAKDKEKDKEKSKNKK